ncbi:unnamed protein product [Adineta steineri]|uniref:Uncharacterized protein n=1 Tax=Adineta steineri TaxID=433720 RepID=A0A815JI35_9BILA|nr:unnamed protein product [Adineta steineri]
MKKYHSHRHSIDNASSSDSSQNSRSINKDQSECHQRNNHNSSLIRHNELVRSASKLAPRKRPKKKSTNYCAAEDVLTSAHIMIIRIILLLIIFLIFYYTFIFMYSKPKQTRLGRFWSMIINWLMGE